MWCNYCKKYVTTETELSDYCQDSRPNTRALVHHCPICWDIVAEEEAEDPEV